MYWNTFGRSALFAAAAAMAYVPWMMAAPVIVGTRGALTLYLIAVTATYLAGLAPTLRRRLGVSVAAAAAGTAVALVAGSLPELVIGLAVVLATGRSAFVLRRSFARAVTIEAVLGLAALVFARFLGGVSPLSMAIAIWGYFLVQSFYFLIGGARVRSAFDVHPDPFEAAHARALALLDGEGV